MTTRRPRHRIWTEKLDLIVRAQRIQEQFFGEQRRRSDDSAWEPPADIFEIGQRLTVWVAIPGVDPQSVEIVHEGSTLRIAGTRALRLREPSTIVRRLEIPHGRFERWIDLPSTSYVLESHEYIHGCVKLTLR